MSHSSVRKVLVTGANGFVGPNLGKTLRSMLGGGHVDIAATSRSQGSDPALGEIEKLDVTDADAVNQTIQCFQPSHVIHLAGLAAIRASVDNPAIAWQLHVYGALNIANAILNHVPNRVLISISSGQVYGAGGRSGQPLAETALLGGLVKRDIVLIARSRSRTTCRMAERSHSEMLVCAH